MGDKVPGEEKRISERKTLGKGGVCGAAITGDCLQAAHWTTPAYIVPMGTRGPYMNARSSLAHMAHGLSATVDILTRTHHRRVGKKEQAPPGPHPMACCWSE